MKGKIIQFRRGKHIIHERHYLVDVSAKNREEAEKFIGKEVLWVSKGKEKKQIKGKISGAHGNKGLVRVIMERGLPGQSLNDEVEIK